MRTIETTIIQFFSEWNPIAMGFESEKEAKEFANQFMKDTSVEIIKLIVTDNINGILFKKESICII